MAFITQTAYAQFCRENQIEVDDNDLPKLFRKYILDREDIFRIFNKSEIRNLLTQTIILLDEGERNYFKFIKKNYNIVEERKDDLAYIFEIKGRLCYHTDRNCSRLNKGFVNFNTPLELSKKKDDPEIKKIILELREWFKHHNFTIDRYKKGEFTIDQFVKSYNNLFPIKYEGICQPLYENYKLLEEKKSIIVGNEEGKVSEFNYGNTLKKLGDIFAERYFICNFNKSYLLFKYNFLYNKPDNEIIQKINELGMEEKLNQLGINAIRRFLERCHQLKNEAIKILSGYIKHRYNFQTKEFDPIFLEQHNFTACMSCAHMQHQYEQLKQTACMGCSDMLQGV